MFTIVTIPEELESLPAYLTMIPRLTSRASVKLLVMLVPPRNVKVAPADGAPAVPTGASGP